MLLHVSDNKLVCLQVLKSQLCWMLNPDSSVLLAKSPLCVYVHFLSMCVFMSVSLHLQYIMFHIIAPQVFVMTPWHKPIHHNLSVALLCQGYEGVMSVLCTPLQVKCYQILSVLFFMLSLSLSFMLSPPLWFPAIFVISSFTPLSSGILMVSVMSTLTEYDAWRLHVESESSL